FPRGNFSPAVTFKSNKELSPRPNSVPNKLKLARKEEWMMGRFPQRYRNLLTLLFVVIVTSMITSAVFLAFYGKKEQSPPAPAANTASEEQPMVQPAAFKFGTDDSASSWEKAIINVHQKVAPAVV